MKGNLNCNFFFFFFLFRLVGLELPHNIDIFSSTYCWIEILSIQLVSIIERKKEKKKKKQKWVIQCGGE